MHDLLALVLLSLWLLAVRLKLTLQDVPFVGQPFDLLLDDVLKLNVEVVHQIVHLFADFGDESVGVRRLRVVRRHFAQEGEKVVEINGLAVALDAVRHGIRFLLSLLALIREFRVDLFRHLAESEYFLLGDPVRRRFGQKLLHCHSSQLYTKLLGFGVGFAALTSEARLSNYINTKLTAACLISPFRVGLISQDFFDIRKILGKRNFLRTHKADVENDRVSIRVVGMNEWKDEGDPILRWKDDCVVCVRLSVGLRQFLEVRYLGVGLRVSLPKCPAINSPRLQI